MLSRVKFAGSQFALKEAMTKTSQPESRMSCVVESTCPLCPTTVRSERLRKRRTSASRNRRFSISKNTRIDTLGKDSLIKDPGSLLQRATPGAEAIDAKTQGLSYRQLRK